MENKLTCNCQLCQQNPYSHTTLEDFRKSTCVDPFTFWGWATDKLKRPKGACSSVVRQSSNSHGCDSNTLGRDNIMEALRLSEQTFRDYLGPVTPEWHKEIVNAGSWGCTLSWRNTGKIVLKNRNVSEVGTPVRTLLGTVDVNTDQYKVESKSGLILDTYTLKLSGVGDIDPNEIRVYVNDSERTKQPGNWRRWQVPTESVTVDGGNLTITGRAYLLGRPELYERYEPLGTLSAYGDYSLDPNNIDCYVRKLDIVRETIDRCDGSFSLYRPKCGCPVCSPESPTCYHCENVAFCVVDSKAGILEPINHRGCNLPDKFCVNYLTEGLSCNRDWTRDIAILAIAYLCQPICGCDFGCLAQWYTDFANEDSKKKTTLTNLENPLGTRSGMLHAWSLIKQHRNNVALAW